MGKMFKPDKSGTWVSMKCALFGDAGLSDVYASATVIALPNGEFSASHTEASKVSSGSVIRLGTFDTERKAMYAARKAALKSLDEWKKADAQAATLDALAESTNEINAEFEDA